MTYFIKQAAGAERGAMESKKGEVAGYISLKHVYEIAKVKSKDPDYDCVSLENICKDVIMTALSCGIKVVKSLGEEEYAAFMVERKKVIEEQMKMLEEKRQAKMLRVV